jgi:hypothetical protein
MYPPALLSSDATRRVAPVCAASVPPWFEAAPERTSSAPFVAIVPPLFESVLVLSDSVPVPELAIMPLSLLSAAGPSARLSLLV